MSETDVVGPAMATEVPKVPAMPPEIATAIIEVMAGVTTLSADSRNKFANYDYVSVDAFYELIGPLLSKAGIFDLAFERNIDISTRETANDRGDVKKSVWLSMVCDIYIYHKSGKCFGPIARTIQVPASGAQAYGSAPSYIKKYFWRDLLKVPCGDPEIDGQPKQQLPAREEPRQEPQRDDTAEFDLRRKAKADYAEFAKITWDTFKSREDMSAWYAAELLKIKETFDGKEDLAFVSFVEAFKSKGATLPEKRPVAGEKPSTDAIPDTPSGAKPRPSITSLKMDLRLRLSEATTEEGCNEAYAAIIEPFEESLKQDEQVDFVRMTKQRIGQIKP